MTSRFSNLLIFSAFAVAVLLVAPSGTTSTTTTTAPTTIADATAAPATDYSSLKCYSAYTNATTNSWVNCTNNETHCLEKFTKTNTTLGTVRKCAFKQDCPAKSPNCTVTNNVELCSNCCSGNLCNKKSYKDVKDHKEETSASVSSAAVLVFALASVAASAFLH